MEKTNSQAFGEKFQSQVAENSHLARALEYYQEKEYATAKMFLEMVVNEEPTVDVFHLLAIVEEKSQGELEQIIIWLNKAFEIAPDSPDLNNTLGDILVERKQYQGAINAFEKTLKLNPDHPDARYNIGASLMLLRKYEEAEKSLRKVLEDQPNHIGALQNLSLALKELDHQQESLETSERLLSIQENEIACNNHGTILKEMNRKEEAFKYFERAIALNPKYAPAYCNVGLMMLDLGEAELAITHYKYAITLNDQDPTFYHNLAFAYFAANRYGEGWDVFRHRKLVKDVGGYTGKPEWEGQPLDGKKLLVTAEQGLGDEIMFASTMPDLSKEDSDITLQCDPRLATIYQRSFPGIKILGVERKNIDRTMGIDYENAIGDLPRFYRRTLDAFPIRDGYLEADHQKVIYWKNRLDELGDGLKVGVCWRSGVAEKIRKHQLGSISKVEYFYPLLDIVGVTVISLQYTDVTKELKLVKKETGKEIVLLEGIDLKNDQDELSALMVALDLTISVGTAVQQMAAAVKGANIWAIPADNRPFHRLMKSPVPKDIDNKKRSDKESFIAQIETATSILTKATKQPDPSKWITEISNQEVEDGRLYPAV
jgi:tetratricopeptide (TPR) repeat protein